MGLAAASLFAVGTARADGQDVPFDRVSAERFVAQVRAEDQPYVLHTGARMILPRRDLRPEFKADRALVYLQFERALGSAEHTELVKQGVYFFGPVNGHTYLARIRPQHLRSLALNPLFRGIEPYAIEDKLTEPLYSGRFSAHARGPAGTTEVRVRFFEDVATEHALGVLERHGIAVSRHANMARGSTAYCSVTHEQALLLAEEPSVRRVFEIPLPAKDDNVVAAQISNIDDIQAAPFSLTGAGVRVGMWESRNPVTTHSDITGRVTVIENNTPGDHATHVSTTIIGDGSGSAAALGMATQARIWSYTSAGDPAQEHFVARTNEQLDATNNSWGRGAGWDGTGTDSGNTNTFGLYDGEAWDWDQVIDIHHDLIVMKSAGNDRSDCDPTDATNCDGTQGADGIFYDNITTFGISKNLITVGAVNDNLTIANFSSAGPADDGRIKPDLVANGVGLFSGWGGDLELTGCPGATYCSISGTSMSSPVTTGAVALLIDLYRQRYFDDSPSAQEIKALLVNTAVDLGRPGPDYLFGHGLVDALAAAQTILAGPVKIINDAVDQDQVDIFLLECPPGTPELRVTLNWTDWEGTPNSNDPDIVNNLDVRLISPGGTSFWPFTGPQGDLTADATATGPNSIDTVEHVRVANPQVGYWTVRVRGISVPQGPESYALVANTAFFLPDQPNIDVAANLNFAEVCIDDAYFQKKTISIFNTGGANLLVHNVEVIAGTGDFELLPFPSPPFVVAPGGHIDMFVVFEPDTPGPRTGTLRITSNDADEGIIDVPMSGTGGVQDVAAWVESKGWFGAVPLGYQQSKLLHVTNQGTCNLQVTSLNLAMGSTDFSVGEIEGFPAFPFTLFPGESALIFLNFQPTAYGPQTAVFNLVTTDITTPTIPVTVRGDCLPPRITLTGSLRFGTVCPGQLVEKTLDICNTGVSDLIVTSVAFDPPCADFTIINNPYPNTVSHDFCLPVTVRYTPTGVGNHTCTLVIQSNDPLNPTVTVTATGTTPAVTLDVAPDICFPPTVVQSLGNCESREPFAVTNVGTCPLTVTAFQIVQPLNEFTALNLPTPPVTLLPGEQLGDGILQISFRPELVQRYRTATVNITYVTNDPAIGDVATITRRFVGEGVNTGLRMLVTQNGVPLATVDKITLYRILYPDTVDEALSIVQIDVNVNLKWTLADGPCPSVPFHQEYGGETNPIVLEPGHYLIVADHNFGAGTQTRKERVVLDDWCDFEEDIVLQY